MAVDDTAHQGGRDWVGYRESIKVLDCTIRDGGLMNNHGFADEQVRAVYQACVESGVDYMELGYKASQRIFAPGSAGDWKFCREDDMRRIVGENDTPLKLSVMCDAERCDYHTDVLPVRESVVDLIRVACYIHQIPTALDMIKDAKDKGYEVTANLMAISAVPERELDEGLALLAASDAQAIYLVDSYGSLYSEQIHDYVKRYRSFCDPRGMKVGIHAHNNLNLGFANTIEAIVWGCDMVDATFAGLGRGAGNCQMELLLAFLHNPKFDLRPVLGCVQNVIEPLRAKLRWGFDLPYLLTGMLNMHPRAAMAFNEAEVRGDIVAFYDEIVE